MADSEAEILFELKIIHPCLPHVHICEKITKQEVQNKKKKSSIWGANDVCLEEAYYHLI